MHTWRRIQVEIDDELTDVLEKMQASTATHIALVIPGRSLLLTSMINLRLIRKKADTVGKQTVVVTRDSMGRNLAEKAGMHAVRTEEELPDVLADMPLHSQGSEEVTVEKKVPANKNEPVIMSRKKVADTIKATTKKEKGAKKGKRTLPATFMGKVQYLLGLDQPRDEAQEVSQFRVHVTPASKKAFVSILSLSLILLVGISIFALPHATVALTPKLANVPVFSNITMIKGATTDAAARQVAMGEISVEYEKEYEYAATGDKFQGTNAKGRVRIYNREGKPRSIVGNSRLQNQEGLVFLTKGFVTVPPSRGSTPGTVDVEVEARDLDAKEQYIGEKGNIPPSRFFFPALTQSSQQLLWAESLEPMTGGTTKIDQRVTSDDLDIANKNIVTDLELLAEEKLREELKKQTLPGNPVLFQPSDNRFVSKELVSVDIPRSLVGSAQPSFKVKGKMRARAYYYNRDDIMKILENHFKDHQLTYNQQLVTMDHASLSFANIFPPRDAQIKVTAKMNGVVSYSFDSDNNELIGRVKDNIVGADRGRALSYLQNLSEVDSVDIQLSPWWQKTLPTLKENITITIKPVTK